MPMGPYSSFEKCLKAQMKKGKSKESAQKICGAIKKKTEGGLINWIRNIFGSPRSGGPSLPDDDDE